MSLIWQGRRGGSMPFDTHVGSQDPKWAGIAFIFQSDAQSCISLVSGILYSKKKTKKIQEHYHFTTPPGFYVGSVPGPIHCPATPHAPHQHRRRLCLLRYAIRYVAPHVYGWEKRQQIVDYLCKKTNKNESCLSTRTVSTAGGFSSRARWLPDGCRGSEERVRQSRNGWPQVQCWWQIHPRSQSCAEDQVCLLST